MTGRGKAGEIPIGFAQGMLDGTIPKDEYEKYLQVIVGETRRLNKLIRELLDLSQLESGNFPLNRQVFDINELIRRVLIRFDDTVEEQKQEIAVEFRQERAMVVADPDRIEQVVINLVDNAVKFTGPGGSIRLWTHSAADKMLIGSALIGLSILGDLPWWVTVVILVREVAVTVLRLVVLRRGVIPASRGGKLKTLVQAVAIGLFVMPLSGAWLTGAWVVMLAAVVLTVLTGIDYFVSAVRDWRRQSPGR